MRKLRSQSYLRNNYPNTCFEKQLINWHGWKIHQRYSRQGDLLLGENQAQLFYPQAPAHVTAQGFFFSSGQAATHTIFETLSVFFQLTPNASGKRIYFESRQLMKNFLRLESTEKFSFIDSAASDFSWDILLEHVKKEILVFDTTCVERDSPMIGKFLETVAANRTPVILTRSHLKLDSFGLEYGNLGSALILNPEQFPPIRSDIERPSDWKSVSDAVKGTGAYLGHFTTVDAIYPFLLSEKVNALNSSRLMRIRENNRRLHQFFISRGMSPGLRPHEYFLELTRKGAPEKLLPPLIEKLRLGSAFPLFYSDSFGFDFSSANLYQDYYGEKGTHVLRLAAPDLVASEFEEYLPLYETLVESFIR